MNRGLETRESFVAVKRCGEGGRKGPEVAGLVRAVSSWGA